MFSESWSRPPDSVVVLADDDPIANGTRWFSTMLPCFTLKITSRRGVRWLCDLPSATFICLLNAGVSISSPAATVPGEGKASLGTFIGLCACSAVPAIALAMHPHPRRGPEAPISYDTRTDVEMWRDACAHVSCGGQV